MKEKITLVNQMKSLSMYNTKKLNKILDNIDRKDLIIDLAGVRLYDSSNYIINDLMHKGYEVRDSSNYALDTTLQHNKSVQDKIYKVERRKVIRMPKTMTDLENELLNELDANIVLNILNDSIYSYALIVLLLRPDIRVILTDTRKFLNYAYGLLYKLHDDKVVLFNELITIREDRKESTLVFTDNDSATIYEIRDIKDNIAITGDYSVINVLDMLVKNNIYPMTLLEDNAGESLIEKFPIYMKLYRLALEDYNLIINRETNNKVTLRSVLT